MPLTQSQIRENVRLATIRVPIIGGWLNRRAVEALVRDGSSEAARWLVMEVVLSKKKHTLPSVLEVLRRFENQRSRNVACGLWLQYRQWDVYNKEALDHLITELGWVASSPVSLQVFTALKSKKREEITRLGAKVVEPLLQACEDQDAVITEQAKLALYELTSPAAKEALCKSLIEKENAIVRDVVLTLKCEPKDESERALFFFLTGQWDRYEELDFDHRQLRVVYDTADPAMRQRIADKLRESGRPHLLSIAVGGDLRSRGGAIGEGEANLLVQAVISHKDWPKLWELIPEVPFPSSFRAVRELIKSGWAPENGDDRDTLRELASLVSDELSVVPEDVRGSLPPAIRRARVRVPGRVNSVGLSPIDPVIAIGTGQGKVVLWNYKRGVRERVLSGFGHSIGHLAFTGNGSLVCAERSVSTSEICAVYGWTGDEVFRLGSRKGPVTAITSYDENRVLSAGRDQWISLWDIESRQTSAERFFDFWARDIVISPNRQQAALLHRGIEFVSLPDLTTQARRTWKNDYVVSSGAYAPDGSGLIASRYGMSLWKKEGQKIREQKLDDETWLYSAQLRLMPSQPLITAANSMGEVKFVSWETRSPVGEMKIPVESLTSINISSDGLMMAVGDSDASMTLWDLRPLELPVFFTRPFSQLTPQDVKTITMFAEDEGLSESVRQSLRFMECIMRHRFRYDVQIDDMPVIQAGDFDIEIE